SPPSSNRIAPRLAGCRVSPAIDGTSIRHTSTFPGDEPTSAKGWEGAAREEAFLVELACAATLLSSPSGGPLVLADGRVGSFRIDVTTEAQLRAAAGRSMRVEKRPAGCTL